MYRMWGFLWFMTCYLLLATSQFSWQDARLLWTADPASSNPATRNTLSSLLLAKRKRHAHGGWGMMAISPYYQVPVAKETSREHLTAHRSRAKDFMLYGVVFSLQSQSRERWATSDERWHDILNKNPRPRPRPRDQESSNQEQTIAIVIG